MLIFGWNREQLKKRPLTSIWSSACRLIFTFKDDKETHLRPKRKLHNPNYSPVLIKLLFHLEHYISLWNPKKLFQIIIVYILERITQHMNDSSVHKDKLINRVQRTGLHSLTWGRILSVILLNISADISFSEIFLWYLGINFNSNYPLCSLGTSIWYSTY